jgi:hypothetical protein
VAFCCSFDTSRFVMDLRRAMIVANTPCLPYSIADPPMTVVYIFPDQQVKLRPISCIFC